MVSDMWRRDVVRLAWIVAICASGCGPNTTSLPRPVCAAPWKPPPNFGPPAARSTTSSVAIELRGNYIEARVRSSFEVTLPAVATDAQLAIPADADGHIPPAGVLVNDVTLKETTVGSERINLLSIRIMPWLLHKEPDPQAAGSWKLSKTPVQRSFTLNLKLAPRLTETGAVIPLDLHELHDDANNEAVWCTTSPDARNSTYDMVTAQVHQGVLDALYGTPKTAGAPPLALPIGELVSLVGGIAAKPVKVEGIALGSDGDLKIGLRFDTGSPAAFSADTGFAHFPTADWGVVIDPEFIKAAITSKIMAVIAQSGQSVTIPGVNVFFESRPLPNGVRENGIWVYAPATANTLLCSVPLSIEADIVPRICLEQTTNRSILQGCTSQRITPDVNACIVFEKLLFGEAKMTVCTPGPCPRPAPADPCPKMADLQFDVGPGDTFYAINLEADNNAFYIAGRSSFIDTLVPARPTVASCP